ncbi:L-type lectin-domain containing receptor kinase IX.1-like [Pyrus ussuriensis x Pyrus communis]|uniref:non-specific serine/threonine protein kinase n=1 Tax=Pyrus ussuriensis x Pyrus communis TaxID=2448454 RepID=A0A5N5HIY0_9ROSA|nr:L-type lectin-domain containing receptor kinase IX.1-like [Pyrus ussuriensis x Pyrus communis]
MLLSRKVTFCLHHYLNNCYFCLFIFFVYFSVVARPCFSSSLSSKLSFTISENSHDTNILYEGDAVHGDYILAELNNHPELFSVGRCTYTEPFHLWDSTTGSLASFSTHFSFTIQSYGREFGDGFAFFLAPVGFSIPPNSAGGGLGLFNSTTDFAKSENKIVTVEFDTYSNAQWDPPGSHVGININQISSVVDTSWNLSSNDGKTAYVSILYDATSKNLTLIFTYHPEGIIDHLVPILSYNIDLRNVLPEWVTIGFSASTGINAERHAIYAWDFSSNMDSHVINRKKKNKKKKAFLIEVVVSSFFVFFVLMFGLVICWVLVMRKRRNKTQLHKKYPKSVCSINSDLERLALPKRFSYQELVAATNGFANDRRLGRGGSGQVYKGTIQDLGFTVAVKRIFPESEHYEKVFINEVKIICRLMHKNLVQFIGWCHEEGECLLVYAYMPNSSLDTHLFGSRTTLQWSFRYKIALGLAAALHYLHEDAEQCVLHRDIKSANVLLDNDFSTKLGDFGIAKLVDPGFKTQTTGVVGTFGYIAPEYANGGRASKESDMFSFGVVALELACGRRTYQDGGFYMPLVSWVWQLYLAGNLLCVADERLEVNFDQNEMECLLVVGLWCTHPNSEGRPKAGQVMKVLQLEAPIPELPIDMHDHPLLPQHQMIPHKDL